MTRYLVRRGTSEVFIWTSILSQREDLEEVFAETPKQALTKAAMPDPRKISIDDLEKMSKADLMIFGRIKMEPPIELTADMTLAAMCDAIKLQIFTQPMPPAGVKPAAAETRPFGSAAEAAPSAKRAGM
jgi:hypothetical protein